MFPDSNPVPGVDVLLDDQGVVLFAHQVDQWGHVPAVDRRHISAVWVITMAWVRPRYFAH